MPRFVWNPDNEENQDELRIVDGSDPEQWEGWLHFLYHDMAAVIRVDGRGQPSSSSSMPRVMAHMLEALSVEDGNDVLEIGTGSGYNAALLCHRLGSRHVTSIDIESDLVEAARERLASVGFTPTLAVADGAAGYPGNAPYDRVIGTCYAWPIPQTWTTQTRPGGHICAIVPSGLTSLTVREDGSASGSLHPKTFGFMPMRGHTPLFVSRAEWKERVSLSEGESRTCRWPARITDAGGDQFSFWVLIGMLVVPYEYRDRALHEGMIEWLDVRDGSWLRLDPDRDQVTQGGPRCLWDEVETLYEEWCRLGAPNRERFGLTVEPDGRHVLWLDDPRSPHQWEVVEGR